MIRALLSLSLGTGAASIVAIESLLALQGAAELGPTTTVSGSFVIQIGFLISAASCLLLAGKMIGGWHAAQKTMIAEVAKIEPLIQRVAKLEGALQMLKDRTRQFDIPSDGESEVA